MAKRKQKRPTSVAKRRRSLTDQENENWRRIAEEIMATRYGGNQSKMAEAMGIEQPTLSEFLARKKGAGVRILRGLERVMASATISGALRRGIEDPYPSRRIVIELARGLGVDESILLALLSVEPPSVDDPGEDFWQEKLLSLEKRRQQLAQKLKAGCGQSSTR